MRYPVRVSEATAAMKADVLAAVADRGEADAVALGQALMPRADRVRYEEVADDLKRYYETTGNDIAGR
jgi:hypothetical protein